MSSNETPQIIATSENMSDEEACMFAMQLASVSVLPMVLKAAIELDLLEIIAKAGPGAALSGAEIAAQLPTTNPGAGVMVDRVLRVLACYAVLNCTLRPLSGGGDERIYGLGPVCKYLTKNEDGVSLAPFCLMNQDQVAFKSWFHLKDAILEGGIPFNKAFGMSSFEYNGTDSRFNKIFNRAMSDYSTITMKKLLETYKGFEGLNSLVDVGGGTGASLSMIVSNYPSIVKGINFDLPHVISDAPKYPGVEHVGGNMFANVPKGDAIFLKWICHNWNDEQCLKLLKNCFDALPEHGKVIVMEYILPVAPDTTLTNKVVVHIDLNMLAYIPGGKERTENEFQALAKAAGFSGFRVVCKVFNTFIMEFIKN